MIPLRIHVLSDLHLEFQPYQPDEQAVAQADVVVLAGDIHKGVHGIRWATQAFGGKPVVYVAGNHEFYGGHWDRTLQEMRSAAAGSNVHFLENDSVTLHDVRFLGCTLWTDFEFHGAKRRSAAMSEAELGMNDYRLIEAQPLPELYWRQRRHRLTAKHTLQRHRDSRAWLERELAQGKPELTVVVTHHLPRPESVAAHYREDLLTGAFASALPAELMCRAGLWIHGHTHVSSDYRISTRDGGSDIASHRSCQVVCNPRGYPLRSGALENGRFDPGLVVGGAVK